MHMCTMHTCFNSNSAVMKTYTGHLLGGRDSLKGSRLKAQARPRLLDPLRWTNKVEQRLGYSYEPNVKIFHRGTLCHAQMYPVTKW